MFTEIGANKINANATHFFNNSITPMITSKTPVHIADRVGGGDAAEVERVVDDRHEEVGRRDKAMEARRWHPC